MRVICPKCSTVYESENTFTAFHYEENCPKCQQIKDFDFGLEMSRENKKMREKK